LKGGLDGSFVRRVDDQLGTVRLRGGTYLPARTLRRTGGRERKEVLTIHPHRNILPAFYS
jgi:hypothetical protein